MHPAVLVPLLLAGMNLASREIRLEQISQQVMLLRSPDQPQRSEARQKLMGMCFDELRMLKYLLEKQKGLTAAQSDPLHEVVSHVYIRRQLMALPREQGAMLGIMMSVPVFLNNYVSTDKLIYSFGIPFTTRPGQIANQYLENGDMILAAGKLPMLSATPSMDSLREIIMDNNPGDLINLLIQRGPVRFNVTIPLDPRFADMENEDGEFRITFNKATYEADEYWKKNFAKIVGEEDL